MVKDEPSRLETRGPNPDEPDDRLPTRDEIDARAETAFYAVAQTFLSEFDGDPDLYPSPALVQERRSIETDEVASSDPIVEETADGRTVACDGGSVFYRPDADSDKFHTNLACVSQHAGDVETVNIDEADEEGLKPCGSCSRTHLDERPVAADGGDGDGLDPDEITFADGDDGCQRCSAELPEPVEPGYGVACPRCGIINHPGGPEP